MRAVVLVVPALPPVAWEEDERWPGSCEGSIDCFPSNLRMILVFGLVADVEIGYYT